MKYIPLTNSDQLAIVSDEDFEAISAFKWRLSRFGENVRNEYAIRSGSVSEGRYRKIILMHRVVARALDGQQVDHVNHNGIDNRRLNLRVCESAQNAAHSRKKLGIYSSKYKGVSYFKTRGRWEAYINKNGVRRKLGYFKDEIEAAKSYNVAAMELFGEFAVLNSL